MWKEELKIACGDRRTQPTLPALKMGRSQAAKGCVSGLEGRKGHERNLLNPGEECSPADVLILVQSFLCWTSEYRSVVDNKFVLV